MVGCFMFQWGWVVFQMGGFILRGGCPMEGISFDGVGFKKIGRIPLPLSPHYEKR